MTGWNEFFLFGQRVSVIFADWTEMFHSNLHKNHETQVLSKFQTGQLEFISLNLASKLRLLQCNQNFLNLPREVWKLPL